MAKLTLPSFVGPPGATQLNTWKSLLEAAVEDQLSRSGQVPNSMEQDLDLDSSNILNVNTLSAQLVDTADAVIAGTSVLGVLQQAIVAADQAEDSAIQAAISDGLASSAANAAEIARDAAVVAKDAAEDAEVQTGLDRIATAADSIQTGLDRVATGEDLVQTGLDVLATEADRVQTGLDAVATEADRIQTGLDRIQTGEDRTQTGLDRVQTGLDVVATGEDRIKAEEWAQNPEDVEVETGQYSALHWAAKSNSVVDTHELTYDHAAYSAHVASTSNPHVTTKAQVGLGDVDNTSDAGKPVSTAQQTALNLKVDKVAGKGLSTEDYTTAEKSKLSGVEDGAQVNVATNLGSSGTGATRTITSSTGTNTSITYSAADVGAADDVHTHTLADVTDSGNLAAINTNSSTVNYLRGDGTWVTPPDTTYSAGNGLTLSGTAFSLPVATSGSGTYVSSITQTAGGITANLGTPPNTNTTYTEVSEAEIAAGTSDFLRTMTGRRGKYIQSRIPQRITDAAYTLVLADAGTHLIKNGTTARTWTIPANSSVAFPIGTAITFVNNATAGDVTIALTTDTLRLATDGTTGSKTLLPWGVATAIKVAATVWIISGTGLE